MVLIFKHECLSFRDIQFYGYMMQWKGLASKQTGRRREWVGYRVDAS